MLKKIADYYTYRVTWSEDDSEFVGLCAELPSLSWLATTPEAAIKGIRKIATKVVQDLKKTKEPIPEPVAQYNFSGKLLVRIPSELHRKLTLEAKESGISLNRLISAKLA